MSQLLNLAVGLAALVVLGLGARLVVRRAGHLAPLPPPSPELEAKWDELTSHDEGGAILGHLERALFFVSLWGNVQIIVGAWLAFKVASKWDVWSNLIAVPKDLPDVDPVEYLLARRRWGARTLMRFLVGTAYNIVAAVVAVAIGNHWASGFKQIVSLVCRAA